MLSDDNVMDEIAGEDTERLLLCALEAGGEATNDTLASLVEGDTHYARELVDQLVRLGLAFESSYDGELSLNGRGRRVATRIEASLADGWRRDDVTRRWVLESARTGGRTSASDLVQQWDTEQGRLGRSAEEIERAINVLAEHHMIKVLNTAQGTIVMGIEQRGLDALERPIAIRPARVPTTIVNNDHSDHSRTINQHGGTIGGVQLGDHSNQHNAVTLNADPGELRAALLRALEHVNDLPNQIADTVRDTLDEMIAETRMPEPRREFVRELAQKVIVAIGAAAGSTAGAAIFSLIGPLAS